ncbi:MAG: DUF547 domain-containing protein, partial [Alphaproteobacteria bacterium]
MADLRKFLFVLVISFIFIPNAGFAQETVNYNYIWERFSDYDANSKARINHQPLTDYLEATVLLVGRSRGFLGNQKPDSYRGSRIKTPKALGPSRFEGSRLLIHAFSEDYKAFFRAYQEGLERLSNRRPIGDLNRNEQAAYWLNLYNVIVINKLVEEYPVQNLKNLRSTKPGKVSFWTEKTTTVEGVRLSLTDIEKILFNNFNSPLVAFGLWQGSVGGPRLLNYAFTGKNVWRALENNAVEFVNSNRGLRPPIGSRLNVSNYYEWTMAAFGTSPDHVLMFIREYADPNFVQGVSGVSTLNFKIYDWAIADLIGGTQHAGTSNQLGGVLAAGSGGLSGIETLTKINATPGANEGTATSSDAMGYFKRVLRLTPTGATEGISQGAIDLLMGIKQNSRLP